MKVKIALVALVLAIGVLLSGLVMATIPSESPQQKEGVPLAVPNPVPGHIFAGNYLRIGINHAGTLGVTNGTSTADPGVGFQSVNDTPFKFPSTESAAIWWWGEGYNIAYKLPNLTDNVAYWQPGYGYPPPVASNIILVSNRVLVNDSQKAVKQVVVKTRDNRLLITFTFTFLKKYPELNLKTTIKNNGTVSLRDIVYKRIIDWDVCTDTWNNWTSTSNAAYAWGTCRALKPWYPPYPSDNKVQLTIAGPFPSYVDLYAWDDQTVRKPMGVVQSFVPIQSDYNAGIYYKIGELSPGTSKTVETVYQSNFPMIHK